LPHHSLKGLEPMLRHDDDRGCVSRGIVGWSPEYVFMSTRFNWSGFEIRFRATSPPCSSPDSALPRSGLTHSSWFGCKMEPRAGTGMLLRRNTSYRFLGWSPKIDHCPRILSIDGGGVRGMSSLLILRNVMEEIARQKGITEARPCEYFDLIGGTGTGGLIAIMLGRLRMVDHESFALITTVCRWLYRWIYRPIKDGFWGRSGS